MQRKPKYILGSNEQRQYIASSRGWETGGLDSEVAGDNNGKVVLLMLELYVSIRKPYRLPGTSYYC